MVRLDTFISGIRVGIVLDDVSFELLTHDKKGYIKKLQFSGAYVIVDNGYLDWLYTVPPFGISNNIDKIHSLYTFISGIRDGKVLDDFSFELITHDKKGLIKKLRVSGVYVIVDYNTWTGRAPSHLLEFLTTLTRYVGQNDAERCQVHIRDSKGGIEEIKKWS